MPEITVIMTNYYYLMAKNTILTMETPQNDEIYT